MALNLEDIAGHPALHRGVREQSLALLQIYEATPRLASVFATQQRWLMAHVGFALHFRRDPLDQRSAFTTTEPIEDEVRDVRLPGPRRLKLWAESHDEQHRQARYPLDKQVEQLA